MSKINGITTTTGIKDFTVDELLEALEEIQSRRSVRNPMMLSPKLYNARVGPDEKGKIVLQVRKSTHPGIDRPCTRALRVSCRIVPELDEVLWELGYKLAANWQIVPADDGMRLEAEVRPV